jgi:hypothetical protein
VITKDSYDLILRVKSFGAAMPETHISSADEGERLEYLADCGYLVRQTLTPATEYSRAVIAYHVSPAGKDACEQYAAYEEDKHTQTQLNDKRWRKDATRSWVQWTITTILSVLSFFAGAIVEKLTGLMEWVLVMFH